MFYTNYIQQSMAVRPLILACLFFSQVNFLFLSPTLALRPFTFWKQLKRPGNGPIHSLFSLQIVGCVFFTASTCVVSPYIVFVYKSNVDDRPTIAMGITQGLRLWILLPLPMLKWILFPTISPGGQEASVLSNRLLYRKRDDLLKSLKLIELMYFSFITFSYSY